MHPPYRTSYSQEHYKTAECTTNDGTLLMRVNVGNTCTQRVTGVPLHQHAVQLHGRVASDDTTTLRLHHDNKMRHNTPAKHARMLPAVMGQAATKAVLYNQK